MPAKARKKLKSPHSPAASRRNIAATKQTNKNIFFLVCLQTKTKEISIFVFLLPFLFFCFIVYNYKGVSTAS